MITLLPFWVNVWQAFHSIPFTICGYPKFSWILDIRNSFTDIRKSFMDIRNSFTDIRNSFMDIRNSFMDIWNSFTDIRNSFTDIRNSFTDIRKSAEFPISKNHFNIASAPPFERIPFSKYQYTHVFKVLSHLFITILTYFSITFLLDRLSFRVVKRLIQVYTQID